MLYYDYAAVSHIGKIRVSNQDNLFICGKTKDTPTQNKWFCSAQNVSDEGVFAICDGMGGERMGELAAYQAVNALKTLDYIPAKGVLESLKQINYEICAKMKHLGGVRMGTTFVSVSLYDTNADIVNLGDSRAYLYRNAQLTQLTHDHTEWQSRLDMGIDSQSIKSGRNALTQHLGVFSDEMLLEPYVSEKIALKSGDQLLLCSDGLWNEVAGIEIVAILKETMDLESKVKMLLQKALDSGGRDNITMILIQITTVK